MRVIKSITIGFLVVITMPVWMSIFVMLEIGDAILEGVYDYRDKSTKPSSK